LIPNLRSFPFWNTSEFPWIIELEAKYEAIKNEFLHMRHLVIQSHRNADRDDVEIEERRPFRLGFQRYHSAKSDVVSSGATDNATDKGNWNVCYFYLTGLEFEENIKNCPTTAAFIR
jgi:hypothetical protein